MCFGLTNGPSTFQRFMNESLVGLEDLWGVYLDDIIVYSICIEQYLGYLFIVLSCLQDGMLSINFLRFDFLKLSLHFLGHVISPGGVVLAPPRWISLAIWQRPLLFHISVFFWIE